MFIHFTESCPAIIISVFLIKSKVDRYPVMNPIPQRKSRCIMSRIFLCCFFHYFGPRDVRIAGRFDCVLLAPGISAIRLLGKPAFHVERHTKLVALFLKFSDRTWRSVGGAFPKNFPRSRPVNGPLVAGAGRFAYLTV